MRGSAPNEFIGVRSAACRYFTVTVLGKTFWFWEKRSSTGHLVAHSDRLFSDYIVCLCDGTRRARPR
jgi:hypothetical protein